MATERTALPSLPPPLSPGEGLCAATDAPLPSEADMYAAHTSPTERRRVDLMYAAACGIEGDAVEPFLRRLALFDVRSEILEEERLAVELAAARQKVRTLRRGMPRKRTPRVA